jgi:hypothetical protein
MFEFVGEIVTNSKMALRNKTYVECRKHAYNMVLDVDEPTENMLDDETTLCLDGIVYNNVARFLTRRCHHANLIEIHVQI